MPFAESMLLLVSMATSMFTARELGGVRRIVNRRLLLQAVASQCDVVHRCDIDTVNYALEVHMRKSVRKCSSLCMSLSLKCCDNESGSDATGYFPFTMHRKYIHL